MKIDMQVGSILRRKANDGSPVKYYLEYIESDGKNALIIKKLILEDKECPKEILTTLLKEYKGKFLYQQNMSFVLETFLGIGQSILEYKSNETPQPLHPPINHD